MSIKSFQLVLSLSLFCFCQISFSQTYIPGNTYYDSTGYVEYRAGNMPIILSAPHGGSLEPMNIPDRVCAGCVYAKDSWTQTVAEGLYDEIYAQTGCYPHLVINLLHRKKFDANRDIGDAAVGNPIVEQSWYAYHAFIDSAKAQVTEKYGRGLFLDIHGHAHTIQRIELGYMLTRAELQQSDSTLNAFPMIEESSIRTLTTDNLQNHTHAELLRGDDSFGTFLVNKGFPAVPSLADPFPQGTEPYFSGGYNTGRHGSRDNQGEIDAIQIELNSNVRFTDSIRPILIDSLAQSALEYYDLHYNSAFSENYCNFNVGSPEIKKASFYFTLHPNPTRNYFKITSDLKYTDIRIYDAIGQEVMSKQGAFEQEIDIRDLESGLYLVKIIENGTLLGSVRLIIE